MIATAPGNLVKLRFHAFEKIPSLRRLRIEFPSQYNAGSRNLVGLNAERHALQVPQTAQQQAGTCEQHQRDGNLSGDEKLAQETARRVDSMSATEKFCAWPLQRRGQAKASARKQGSCQRKSQDPAIQSRAMDIRNALRRHSGEGPQEQPGQRKSGNPTECAEQETLAQRLPRRAQAACAQSYAHRQFPLFSRGPGQQQIRHIGAGNQKDRQH